MTDRQLGKAENRPAVLPGFLLGIGFGGFIDGILLHQILQWHHMLTATGDHPASTIAGLEANTVADGLFHVASWAFVLAGIILSYRAWRADRPAPPRQVQAGLLLTGWAAFNLVEGLVDHHLLGIHNVRDDVADPALWNLAFLAFSAVLLLVGVVLARPGFRRPGAQQDGSRSSAPSVAGRPVESLGHPRVR